MLHLEQTDHTTLGIIYYYLLQMCVGSFTSPSRGSRDCRKSKMSKKVIFCNFFDIIKLLLDKLTKWTESLSNLYRIC